jgi:phage baseplate assembly protein V
MIDHLFNKMKAAAATAAERVGQNRWGTVSSTRSTDTGYQVKVLLQPEGVLSGWLPVLSPMVGGSWGLVSPPAIGQQAFVASDLGDPNHGVVLGMAFSTQNTPPQPQVDGNNTPVKEGQFAIVHKNGSYLLFDDDDVRLVTNRDLIATVGRNLTATVTETATVKAQTINLNAPTLNADDGNGGKAQWNLHADVHVNGDVFDFHGSLDRLRANYDAHRHAGVQPGTGVTGTTTTSDPE